MKNRLYIDGKDAYAEWRVFLTNGSYRDLIRFAPLKNVESNQWQEIDGAEFDLSAPVLDSRELSIGFASHGSSGNLGAFMELLSDRAYHDFEFRELERTYKLRLVSQPNLELCGHLGIFTLSFADDFPQQGYKYKAPDSDMVPVQGYEIDAVDFSEYGVWVLKGSLTEIKKSPAVKMNLLRDIISQKGAIYDGKEVIFQTKEVKLSCLMRANSLTGFWQNYDALLFDLSKPNERSLYVENTGYEYPCYYKSCSVSEFYTTGKIWFKFDITMVFTSFRVEDDEYLLASEAGQWIMTEEGDFAVDLKEY